jgi:hypothetical protein
MAATLFAEPPVSSMDEARDHFLAAEDLKPDGWKENRQFLAKCFISLKDYRTAVEWLDKANELPVNNPDVSCRASLIILENFVFVVVLLLVLYL